MPDGTPQPRSHDDIPAEAEATLTAADIPPDEQDYARAEALDGPPPELAALNDADLTALLDATPPSPAPAPQWPLSYPATGRPWPAGIEPRDGAGTGSGFADGGALDLLDAGAALAGLTDDAHARLDGLPDDDLVGVLRAWRRLTSWAQASELAAIAALARRRPADGTPPAATAGQFPATVSEFVGAEVAAALTLTAMAAEKQVTLALQFTDRPATAAALAAGRIDLPRARLLASTLSPLATTHAATVEALILPQAPGMTTGQLRAALDRAILALDPDAMRRRREEAERDARVEHYPAPDGTATLAGRNLPPAQVLAADKRLTALAAAWKKHGAQGGMDLLRAHAYLALLNGLDTTTPPASLLPDPGADGQPDSGLAPGADGQPRPDGPAAGHDGQSSPRAHSDPAADPHGASGPGHDRQAGRDARGHRGAPGTDGMPGSGDGIDRGAAGNHRDPLPGDQLVPAGLRRPPDAGELPPLTGLVRLTIPLTTLMQLGDAPGDAAGYGPLHADTARQLACALAGHRATRWQIIVTAPDGTALAAGINRGPAGPAGPVGPAGNGSNGLGSRSGSGSGWTVRVTAEPIATSHCDHRNAEPGCRPSPALQRLIRARTTTCTGPGCRRPADRNDLDHTVAYDDGGITCECQVAPLCRFCHRLKQSQGWKLEQPSPGVMIWITPAGRRHVTRPTRHPF